MNNRGIFIVAFIVLALLALPMSWSVADDIVRELAEKYEAPPPTASDTSILQPKAASEVDKLDHEYRMARQKNKITESLLLVGIASLAIVVVLFFITKTSGQTSAEDIIHASGLVLIIFATILVVAIADTDQQLTASMGVLGAIAGYLFGRMSASGSVSRPQRTSPSASPAPPP